MTSRNILTLLLTCFVMPLILLTIYIGLVQCVKEMNSDDRSSVNNPIMKMINPGDRIDIPCSVVSPGGSVQWVQNGKPILLDFSLTQRRHWNISNDGQAALTINRATKADEGIWECWELDSEGIVKQKAHVMKLVITNIPEEPFIELEGRRLANQATITVREKNEIKLNCVVRGASPPVRYVHWYLADQNLTQSSKLLMEYSTEEDVSMAISLLVVNITRHEHAKMVICRVYHVSWLNPATVSASFNVLYVPSFSISREPGFGFPIMEGMDVSLKCEIDANPLSIAKWHRDGSRDVDSKTSLPQLQTNLDGTLNFSSITLNDSGWYRCTTNHEFGYFASFGYYLNVRNPSEIPELQHIFQSPLLLSPKKGIPIDKETKARKEVEPNEAALMKPHDEGRGPLQAASISNSPDIMVNGGFHNKYDERLYDGHHQRKECGDTNGKPVVESINRTLTAMVGRTISLTAKFCCNPRPKKVYWIHRHLAMTPGRVIGPYITRELMIAGNSIYCYTSTFNIDSVKPEDAGEVIFIVGNSKGLDDAMVLLNITHASYSVSRGSSLLRYTTFNTHILLLTIMMLTSFMWHHWMPVIGTLQMKRFICS